MLAVLSPVSAHAAAGPVQAAPRVVNASAAELFVLTRHMVNQGQRGRAHRLLQLLGRDPNEEVRDEARFRRAQLLAEDGRKRDAAVLLRRILDDRPDAAAVRLKLVALLQDMGELEMAFRELRALQSAKLPANVGQVVDRLSASLQASKPWGVQVEAAIAPDTNINRATTNPVLGTVFGNFEIAERAKSGVGFVLRGAGQVRGDAGDGIMLAGRVSGSAALYGKTRFNDISLGFAAGPEFTLGRTRIGAEAGLVQQWYGMKPYQRTVRIAASVVQSVGSVAQVRLDPAIRWTDDMVNNLRDGRGVAGTVSYERALSPQTIVSLTAAGERYIAVDAAYSTKSWLIGASVVRDVGRMTFSATAELGELTADDRLGILLRPRSDRLTRLTFRSVFRQITFKGFAPMAKLVIERNRSTVEFHDFRHSRTEFGVIQAF